MLGILGFSVIITESINSFHLFEFRIALPFIAVPFLILFMCYLYTEKIIQRRLESHDNLNQHRKLILISRLIFLSVFIFLVVLVPLIWWGAIRKLATIANEGKVAY